MQKVPDIMQQRSNHQFITGAGLLRQHGALQGVFHLVDMFAIAQRATGIKYEGDGLQGILQRRHGGVRLMRVGKVHTVQNARWPP